MSTIKTPFILTYTGRKVDPTAVTDFDIRDIAHALSMKCRYSGHTKNFYSVAQHSILAAKYSELCDPLVALLHDASEAYLVDIPSPLKALPEFAPLVALEKDLEDRIFRYFVPYWDQIKGTPRADYRPIDHRLLSAEMMQLINGWQCLDWIDRNETIGIEFVDSYYVEQSYLEWFSRLL